MKEYFITLTPLAARQPRNPVAHQYSRPSKPKQQTPPEVTTTAYPELPKRATYSPPTSATDTRVQRLEATLRMLLNVMTAKGIPIGPEISACLDYNLPPPVQMSDDEVDSQDDYQGDLEVLPPDAPLPKPEPKGKRRKTEAPSVQTLCWSHAAPLPYQHLVWGRVKGDGNCFWRSLGQLTSNEWPILKNAILALAPTLANEWCSYFATTPAGCG